MFALKFSEQLALIPGLTEELDGFYKRLSAFLAVAHADDGSLLVDPPAAISDLGLPVGSVQLYAGTSVPTGWLVCDGSAISRETYRTLFDAISTTYGVGDGATTFNLPDLRGRFPLGVAAAGTGSTLGATGGTIDHTHTGPSHTHAVTGVTVGTPSTTAVVAAGAGSTVASATHTHALTGSVDAAGAGNTGSANPPFLALRFLILVA